MIGRILNFYGVIGCSDGGNHIRIPRVDLAPSDPWWWSLARACRVIMAGKQQSSLIEVMQ